MSSDFLNLKATEELPEGWRPTTIGDVATLQRGNDLSVSERRTGPFPVVGSNGIAGWHDKFVARGPGVFVGRSGSVGKVTWVETDYWPLNTALWVKDFHGNDRQFIYYLLSSLNLSQVAAGVSVPTLNRNLVHPLRVVVPGEKEQRAIASVLQTVQGAKEACERVLAATRQLKQSLLHHLFTYGPVPFPEAAHVPLKETEVGPMPGHWQPSTVEDLCEAIVDCPHSTPRWTESGVLAVKNVNIRDGQLRLAPPFFTSEEDYSERVKRLVPKSGDVLFSREAPVGEACVIPDKIRLSLGQRIMLLRPKGARICGAFFVRAFYSPGMRNLLDSMGKGVTAKHVNVADVRGLMVFAPPVAEQRAIAAQLSAVDSKLAAEEARRAALAALFQSLLHHLMTGRVRVKDSQIQSQDLDFRER